MVCLDVKGLVHRHSKKISGDFRANCTCGGRFKVVHALKEMILERQKLPKYMLSISGVSRLWSTGTVRITVRSSRVTDTRGILELVPAAVLKGNLGVLGQFYLCD